METKPYMKTGRSVSRLGFGGWPLGNTAHGHTMSIEEGVSLVREAYRQGITFFDTAPNYANGRSETILGEALKGIRNNVVINTKFGHHPDGRIDFSETLIRSSVEGSLKRLQTDYLDSVILHNPPHDVLKNKTDHFNELEALKREGILNGYGVSVDTPDELSMVLEYLNVDVVEILFNIFSQQNRVHFEQLQRRGISIIVKVPLDSGWLSGKYSKDDAFTDIRSRWSESDLKRRHDLVEELKKRLDENGSLIPYAIGYVLSYDAITTVIPGIRTVDQLKEHLHASKTQLTPQRLKDLEAFYHQFIENAPLPW